jgi:hypothetical protein
VAFLFCLIVGSHYHPQPGLSRSAHEVLLTITVQTSMPAGDTQGAARVPSGLGGVRVNLPPKAKENRFLRILPPDFAENH